MDIVINHKLEQDIEIKMSPDTIINSLVDNATTKEITRFVSEFLKKLDDNIADWNFTNAIVNAISSIIINCNPDAVDLKHINIEDLKNIINIAENNKPDIV